MTSIGIRIQATCILAALCGLHANADMKKSVVRSEAPLSTKISNSVGTLEDDGEKLDCKGDYSYVVQDECERRSGARLRAETDRQISKWATTWNRGVLEQVKLFNQFAEQFAKEETIWSLESVHGGGPYAINSYWKETFRDQLLQMVETKPTKTDAANFRSEDEILNKTYKEVVAARGDSVRASQRAWLKAREAICRAYQLQFKSVLTEKEACDAARERISKVRIRELRSVLDS